MPPVSGRDPAPSGTSGGKNYARHAFQGRPNIAMPMDGGLDGMTSSVNSDLTKTNSVSMPEPMVRETSEDRLMFVVDPNMMG